MPEEEGRNVLICNQCKAKGETCLDRSHILTQHKPGVNDFNDAIAPDIEFCPRAQYVAAAIRCRNCKATPGTLFLRKSQCFTPSTGLPPRYFQAIFVN